MVFLTTCISSVHGQRTVIGFWAAMVNVPTQQWARPKPGVFHEPCGRAVRTLSSAGLGRAVLAGP